MGETTWPVFAFKARNPLNSDRGLPNKIQITMRTSPIKPTGKASEFATDEIIVCGTDLRRREQGACSTAGDFLAAPVAHRLPSRERAALTG